MSTKAKSSKAAGAAEKKPKETEEANGDEGDEVENEADKAAKEEAERQEIEAVSLGKFQDKEGRIDPRIYQAYFRSMVSEAVSGSFVFLGSLQKYLQRFGKSHSRDSDVTKQRKEMESPNFEATISSLTNQSRLILRPFIAAFKKLGFFRECEEYNNMIEVRDEFTEMIKEILTRWEASRAKIVAQMNSGVAVEPKKGKKKAAEPAWPTIEYTTFLTSLIVGYEYYAAQIASFKAAATALKTRLGRFISSVEFVAICEQQTDANGLPFVLVDVFEIKKFVKGNSKMLEDAPPAKSTVAKRQRASAENGESSKRAKKSGADDADEVEDSGEARSDDDEDAETLDSSDGVAPGDEEAGDSEESLIVPTQVIEFEEEVINENGEKVIATRKRSRTLRPRTKQLYERIIKTEKKLTKYKDDDGDDSDEDEAFDIDQLKVAKDDDANDDDDDDEQESEENDEDIDDLDEKTANVEGQDLDDDDEDDDDAVDSEEEAELAEEGAKLAKAIATGAKEDVEEDDADDEQNPEVAVVAGVQQGAPSATLEDISALLD
jgi:hypothetical protein